MTFNFVQLNQLKPEHKDQIVDVIGVCRSANEVSTINSSRTGKEYTKRDLQIVDQRYLFCHTTGTVSLFCNVINKKYFPIKMLMIYSLVELQLTLWGKHAESFDSSGNPVIAIKGCKVSDYSGVSLGALSSSVVQINPDIQKCHELKGTKDVII